MIIIDIWYSALSSYVSYEYTNLVNVVGRWVALYEIEPPD